LWVYCYIRVDERRWIVLYSVLLKYQSGICHLFAHIKTVKFICVLARIFVLIEAWGCFTCHLNDLVVVSFWHCLMSIGYMWLSFTRWLSWNSCSIEYLWKHCKFHVFVIYYFLCNILIVFVWWFCCSMRTAIILVFKKEGIAHTNCRRKKHRIFIAFAAILCFNCSQEAIYQGTLKCTPFLHTQSRYTGDKFVFWKCRIS